jgi:hypothetical protein
MNGGGARTNLFMLDLQFPQGIANADNVKTSYMVKEADIPGVKTTSVENVGVSGRDIPLVGEREFEDYTITLWNDTDFKSRARFEAWGNLMIGHNSNRGLQNPEDYMVDFEMHSLDRNGEAIQTYNFHNAWASDVTATKMSRTDKGTVQEFSVTFKYTHWTNRNTDSDNDSGLFGF